MSDAPKNDHEPENDWLTHYVSLPKEEREKIIKKLDIERKRSEVIINGRRIGKTQVMIRALETLKEWQDGMDKILTATQYKNSVNVNDLEEELGKLEEDICNQTEHT